MSTILYGGWGKGQSAGVKRGEGLGLAIAGECVENGLSDMHFLRIRVRQSRSFSLSTGFLLSELDLPY